jgi:cyclic pyranopterin phosphate synthase
MSLIDACGRPVLNLRIAITQRCSYHCTYCHREGEVEQANAPTEMTVEEIVRIAKIGAELGIKRVKLTGGEPLMRSDICQIVKDIKAIPGLKDISLTTNGLMLKDTAKELHAAGLNRINISLVSLNPETYTKITGGNVEDALAGVEAAVEAGFNPVKLNMVILKGVNVYDVPEMIEYAKNMGVILQLIELDPVNVSGMYYQRHHRSLEDQEEMLRQKAVNIEARRLMQNRLIYQLSNVTVEVVHPIENTDFCNHCTKLRVTSDGKLKPCLMRNDNLTDILTPMRQGVSDEELKQLFRQANQLREPYNKSV